MAMDDDALSRALMMAGLGMIGARNPWEGIARGGMFGLQGYDQGVELKDKRKLLEAKLLEEQLQAQQKQAALDRAKKMQEILGAASQAQAQPPGSQRSIVDAPGWNPQVAAAPARKGNVAQMLLDAGFTKEAEDYAKTQGAIHGEAYGDLKVTQSGKPYYMTKQGPRYVEDGSIVPREELHFGDTGDRTNVGFNKFTGAEVSPGVRKGMSAAERDAAARGWAGVNLQREQFNRGELREAPMENGNMGLAWVTPKGANFVPGTGQKQERLHDAAAEKLLTLDQMSQVGQTALAELRANGGTGPLIGKLPDFAANWFDAKGMKTRQFLADLTTQITLARSGAAVTKEEYARLEPFLAKTSDTEAIAEAKLENLLAEYSTIRKGRSDFYKGQGYKVPEQSMGLAPPEQPNRQSGRIGVPMSGRTPSVAELQAEAMRRGMKVGG